MEYEVITPIMTGYTPTTATIPQERTKERWKPLDAKAILRNATVITLRKRPERLEGFGKRFGEATRGASFAVFYGYDGEKIPVPESWKASKGAFGCCLAHVSAWARVLSDENYDDDTPLLFFEDDAIFCENFYGKLEILAPIVPDDWDMIYLGGEHLRNGRKKPEEIAQYCKASLKDPENSICVGLVKAYNVNRMHAYVVRARAFRKIFPRLLAYAGNAPKRTGPSGDETPHDYEFGRMMESGEIVVYAASPFLVGQGAFGSDTYANSGADRERFWN